jgi:predicted neutral ceramidase superfamily lipid hydrolase
MAIIMQTESQNSDNNQVAEISGGEEQFGPKVPIDTSSIYPTPVVGRAAQSVNTDSTQIEKTNLEKPSDTYVIGTAQKVGYFMLGFSGLMAILIVIITSDATWDVLDMPIGLFLLNLALVVTTNILAIVYSVKRNKPRLRYFSWGILIGFIVMVVFVIIAGIIMGMAISRAFS